MFKTQNKLIALAQKRQQENHNKHIVCGTTAITTETFAELTEIRRLSTEIHSTISKVHNSLVGHHGVDRTIEKLIKLNQELNLCCLTLTKY